jgi:hypothetical protein
MTEEINELKSLLVECARALWQPRNYTSQQMLDLIERANAANQERAQAPELQGGPEL